MTFRYRRMQVFSGYKIRGTVPALRRQITAGFPVCRLLLRGAVRDADHNAGTAIFPCTDNSTKTSAPRCSRGAPGRIIQEAEAGNGFCLLYFSRGDLFYVTPPSRVTGNSEPCICARRRPVLRFTAPSVRFSLSRQVNRGGIGRSAKQRRALSGLHFRVVGLHSPIITHPAGMRVQNCNGNQIIRRSRSLRTEYRQSGRQYRRMLRHRRRGTQRFPRRFHPARI